MMENKDVIRTFIAIPIELPKELKNSRKVLIKELREERIRWVSPERMHITLHFFGDTSYKYVQEIRQSMDEIYASCTMPKIEFGGWDFSSTDPSCVYYMQKLQIIAV